jgi:hypothetical protein
MGLARIEENMEMDEATLKILDAAIKLKREEMGHTVGGRDPYAEAARDMRSYSADPYSRHRLAERSSGGTPVAGANVPPVLTIEQVDGKWWGNKPAYGPFDTVRDLEIAVYGRSDLSAAKRGWRDGPWPADE